MEILTERRIVAVVRWTARAIGIALLGLFVVLAIGGRSSESTRFRPGGERCRNKSIRFSARVASRESARHQHSGNAYQSDRGMEMGRNWWPPYFGRVCLVCHCEPRSSAQSIVCGGRAVAGDGAAVLDMLVENTQDGWPLTSRALRCGVIGYLRLPPSPRLFSRRFVGNRKNPRLLGEGGAVGPLQAAQSRPPDTATATCNCFFISTSRSRIYCVAILDGIGQ